MPTFSPKRFTNFLDFKPCLSPEDMLRLGICGKTLFSTLRAKSKLPKLTGNDPDLILANMSQTYRQVNNQTNTTIPKKLLVTGMDSTKLDTWALWYYHFYFGLKSDQDAQQVLRFKETLKQLWAFLKQEAQSEAQMFNKAFKPEITQAMLEMGWDRAVEWGTYEIKGTVFTL